jgi:AraC-like DNA-binding protein
MIVQQFYEFRSVIAGVETLSPGASMARHHHNEGYATIVLAGSLTEVSFAGRMCAEAGDVLLHGRFDCHLDKGGMKGPLQILRLPWPHDTIEGQFRVTDPDALARLAEIDPERASARLHEELRPVAARERYWVDELAEALRSGSDLPLQEWAEIRGLRPTTLSSVFHREFGVYPKRFRLESRTRLAWREIVRSTASLTEIALNLGFSDLPHLTRSVHLFTGRSPRDWRTARS